MPPSISGGRNSISADRLEAGKIFINWELPYWNLHAFTSRNEGTFMGKNFGFSWSWKGASGLSALRGKTAKQTGIPTTRGGLERKIGRTLLNFILSMFR